MEIVSVENIPKGENVPLDNLMKVYKVCLDMEKVCLDGEGIGLAAPQVGIPWKLFIIKSTRFEYYVNCEFQPLVEKDSQSIEGCLSLRKLDGSFRRFLVKRFSKIKIKGKRLLANDNLVLEDVDMVLDDYRAIIFQHEMDHFLGVEGLISSIGEEIDIVK
jgi:peptide deformylase